MFRIRNIAVVAVTCAGLLIVGVGTASATDYGKDAGKKSALDDVNVNVVGVLNDLDALNDVLDAKVRTKDTVDAKDVVDVNVGDVKAGNVSLGDINAGNVSVGHLGVISVGDVLNGNNVKVLD